jgi:hypothetical protein
MDPNQLWIALHAGAAIAGAEVVKEPAKDAYRALKAAVTSIFGRRAERALDGLEGAPGDEVAKKALMEAVPVVESEDADDLRERVSALLSAMAADQAATQVAETVASIRLDIEAGGRVTLEEIRGARQIDVKSKSEGDFTMRAIDMDRGAEQGNQ